MPTAKTPPAMMTTVTPPTNLIDNCRQLSRWSGLGHRARNGSSLRGTNCGKTGKSADRYR